MNPLPKNTGDVLQRYDKILIPEMNLGQLALLIRGRFLVDAQSFTKVQGLPIHLDELEAEMLKVIDG
jgi:2-oxoglutarate ferredoxin oxidoreductase subunit alpha